MRLLYSIALYCLLPFLLLWLMWRSLRAPGYRSGIGERFGFVPGLSGDRPVIWVHAVSVGEFMAARPLIDHLLSAYPVYRILVTTSTPTARKLVSDYYGEKVALAYAPWDLPDVSRRFLARSKPCLLILLETELWPNWLHYCQLAGCKVLLANGRLSARSAAGYQRAGGLALGMFTQLDAVACQDAESAQRLQALGVSKQALTITGSIKYDGLLPQRARKAGESLRQVLAAPQRVVVVACSTHPREDEAVLRAFQQLRNTYPDSVLLLAPRHPERAGDVARLCLATGLSVARRSKNQLPGPAGGVLLCDTMGELAMLCGAASAAFVGGSLVPKGGQNPLDAVQWNLPVLMGPHTQNFSEMVAQLRAAGALEIVTNGQELGDWWVRLAGQEALAARMGQGGQEVLLRNSGALEKVAPLVADLLAEREQE